MSQFKYRVIDESNKIIELTYLGQSQQFQLKVKRSFVVLTHLAERYPSFMNIHDLDGIYNDPNKALSELKLTEGWNGYIQIEKRENRVTHAKLNVRVLFATINPNENVIRFFAEQRGDMPLERRRQLFKKFQGKCNITGIRLHQDGKFDDPVVFMKRSQTPAYDHRQPLSKGGTDQDHNLQLISEYANMEKNRICNSCVFPKCNQCALAHPESIKTIYPTKQDISVLRQP